MSGHNGAHTNGKTAPADHESNYTLDDAPYADDHGDMEDGQRMNALPVDTHVITPGASQFDPVVTNAVASALDDAREEAKWEAGSAYGRRVPPLLLGPQRYRDPAMYAPPAEARPEIGGSGPDASKKLPLTDDPQYEAVLVMLDELDARTGWPGGSD